MPDNYISDNTTPDDETEQQIGLQEPDAFPLDTQNDTVSGARLFADGGDGKEKEVDLLDPIAGASSAAPASSGIPSAVREQSIHARRDLSGDARDDDETRMADRTISLHEDTKP